MACIFASCHILEPISVVGLKLNDTCLKNGSTVSLRCEVRGFPRPRIDFHQNNILIAPGSLGFDNYMLEFYDQVNNVDLFIQY